MIKILILDDSAEKIRLIQNFLFEVCNIEREQVEARLTIKDGRRILYSKQFDLLLLDLVMPSDDESEPSPTDSLKFLEEIYYNPSINIPIHIIGFSQHDDLIQSNLPRFEDKLWHLIHFSFTNNIWKDKLKHKVLHLVSVNRSFEVAMDSKYTFDICILCALQNPELSAVLKLPVSWEKLELPNDPLIYHHAKISTVNGNTFRILACSINKMGMSASALVTSMIIAKFKVKFIFMAGICAGIEKGKLNFGDIIVAENALDYGFGKISQDSEGQLVFSPEPHQLHTDQNLIAKLSDFIGLKDTMSRIQNNWEGRKMTMLLNAHIGPVASGSFVIASSEFLANIKNANRKLLGVDMESHGMYLACHYFSQTRCLFAKSVCDFADAEKNDDYQPYAAFTSAQFIHSFILTTL